MPASFLSDAGVQLYAELLIRITLGIIPFLMMTVAAVKTGSRCRRSTPFAAGGLLPARTASIGAASRKVKGQI